MTCDHLDEAVRGPQSIVRSKNTGVEIMKKGIHPEFVECTITCTCGKTYQTRSTTATVHVEICAGCHPFFTGKQRLVDTAGRVEKFHKKYGSNTSAKAST
jgi:large subunit ribosomal protein L31